MINGFINGLRIPLIPWRNERLGSPFSMGINANLIDAIEHASASARRLEAEMRL